MDLHGRIFGGRQRIEQRLSRLSTIPNGGVAG
jgi:hypothetical protein